MEIEKQKNEVVRITEQESFGKLKDLISTFFDEKKRNEEFEKVTKEIEKFYKDELFEECIMDIWKKCGNEAKIMVLISYFGPKLKEERNLLRYTQEMMNLNERDEGDWSDVF